MPEDPAQQPGASDFEKLAAVLRPKLHRYCARMTGSVVDGEDVVQDTLIKALEALPKSGPLEHPEGWLFRIAHNAALDHLRRRARQQATFADEDMEMIADPNDPVPGREAAAASLHTFMRLPVSQRSAIILRDVLGHSVAEAGEVMGATIPAVKGALQRGRERLQELAKEGANVQPPALAPSERAQLTGYIDRFAAHDFDAIRTMLADDVRLELVNRVRMDGKGTVGTYFHRYAEANAWNSRPGLVDGQPAILMYRKEDTSGRPEFFILIDWKEGQVAGIRDFLFAPYVMEAAEVVALG
jgi:RNA polymerase sigma-70 factor (ECF subfamily)